MATIKKTNIHSAVFTAETPEGDLPYTFLDLSGKRLGARIERLNPSDTSSYHHYHTLEEEHVFVLEGEGTLHTDLGSEPITQGDHLCFEAGSGIAHHLENTGKDILMYLVYGERNGQDVVVYPRHQTMLVKGMNRKLVTYREIPNDNVKGVSADD